MKYTYKYEKGHVKNAYPDKWWKLRPSVYQPNYWTILIYWLISTRKIIFIVVDTRRANVKAQVTSKTNCIVGTCYKVY